MFSSPELNPNVPAFIAKLWHLVTDPATNNLILWGPDGTSFLIRDHVQFSAKLLPMYYKHNNMASFIRQLNMYGFHKVVSVDSTSLRNDKGELEFSHSCFLQDRPALLDQIKRKMAHTKDLAGVFKGDPHILNKLLQEVQQVKSRQGMFDSKLAAMKAENDALWREHSILRQKHAQQQTIVNKLIQFLVTLVQQTRGLNLKRRVFPLMLKEGKQLATITNHAHDPSTGPIICELDPSEFYYEDISNIIAGNSLNNGSSSQDEQKTETVINLSEPILDVDVPHPSPKKDLETDPKQNKTFKRHTSGGGAARTTGVVKAKRRKRKFSSVLPSSETSNDEPEIITTTNENDTTKKSKQDDTLNLDYTLPIVTSPGGSSLIATSDAHLFEDLGVSFVDEVPTQPNTKFILKSEPIEMIVNNLPKSDSNEFKVEQENLGNCAEEEEEEENSDMSLVPSGVNPGAMSKEEMDSHLSMIESDLDILKDILKGDGLSLDANTLLELFSSEDPLNLNMPGADNETGNTAKESSSGTELISYTPNLVDMVDIMKDDAGETSGFELLDAPELNTPLSSLVGLDFPQSPAASSALRHIVHGLKKILEVQELL